MKPLAIIFFFFLAPFAHAAIAVDATSAGDNGPGFNSTTATWSHTTTGSNLILVCGVYADVADSTTGVTYNGTSLTLIDKQTDGSRWEYLFYLIAPTTGAHNVVVTDSVNSFISGECTSYTGAKQSGQPDSTNKGTTASGTSLTVSTTVVASNSWLVGMGSAVAGSIGAGTGTTLRQLNSTGNTGSAFFDSNGTVGTGSQSLQITGGTPANQMGLIVASFAPAAATPAVVIPPSLISFLRPFWLR